MSSVLNTSTMKSPPLVVCEMGSFDGGIVSAAANLGPGTAAFVLALAGSDICVLAETGVARVAAPASVAPLRKLRRPVSGELLRFDMVPSREAASDAKTAPHRFYLFCNCRALFKARQDSDKLYVRFRV